ncbi:MurR/RpiR family transcriptional regulator [uncultured Bradyrhizobium sp.]|mgnify:CR=1 FL=1|jgi:DNA-binding MurR/RpiR family transcriptional regulator|uniref:MurR/RpiR family transcriptional regulator n=1 Tax=uncultured Bradyrhizobium sp. TaxID=199684 RepID=UPI00261AC4DE|nr:MurR/RpiR family transcriptional regulator [uncultured Bradyrhizobium sp.]
MPRAKRIQTSKAAGTAGSTPLRRDAFVAGDIVSVIRQSAPSLSPSEQRVAMALLADVEFAIHASNAELARSARVSEPTVTRFSRSVGCRGVRDLKVRLAQAMAVGRIYLELPPHVGTDLARPALWRSVFQEIRRAIAAAEEGLRREDIDRAAEAISRCSKLAAFGVGGGSTLAAMEVQNRFFRLGIAVSHSSDPILMRMIAATFGRGDVVVAISTTGMANEVIEAARIAKQNSALVVAITKPQSKLASIADIALGVHVPEAPDALKPTASRYALLAAIDLLAASTAYCKPLEAQTRMRRIKYELLKGTDGSSNGPLGD